MDKWSIEFTPARHETGFTSVLFRCTVEEDDLRLGRDLNNLDEEDLKLLAMDYLVRTGALKLRVRKYGVPKHEEVQH